MPPLTPFEVQSQANFPGKLDLVILGPGKVGTAIGVLARAQGYRVRAVGGRNLQATQEVARRIGEEVRACTLEEAAGLGGLALLTVSDGAIESVCRELAAANAFQAGAVVAHCSGALDSTVLASAREQCGCVITSAHPLQTFPTVDAALARLAGTHWFCEGEERALACVETLAVSLGAANVVRLPARSKPLYHAAAALACNDLVALLDVALETAERAGIPRGAAWAALEPIVKTTIDNVGTLGTPGALTGPIARGDAATVERHLAALADDPESLEVYCALGRRAVSLALRKGTIEETTAAKLRSVLAKKTEA